MLQEGMMIVMLLLPLVMMWANFTIFFLLLLILFYGSESQGLILILNLLVVIKKPFETLFLDILMYINTVKRHPSLKILFVYVLCRNMIYNIDRNVEYDT